MKVYRFVTGPIQVNTYLAYDDTKKGFIVDPGGFSYGITETVEREGIDGVAEFQEKYPNAKVIAYVAERDMLEDPALNSSYDIYRKAITVTPDQYVSDRETLTVGETELTFIHTPGHSLGGMCILTPGYVFSGDTIFRASIGRTDFYGGSFEQLAKSIRERLYILPDQTLVLPGHMGETTIGFEKEHNPFVPN